MKRIFLLIALTGILISCSKEDGADKTGSPSTGGSDKYTDGLSDGTGSPGSSSGSGSQGGDTIQSGQITAGEWNDLVNWDFWNDLSQNQDSINMPEYWSYNLNSRISVQLQNLSSENLNNQKVELLLGSDVLWLAKTDNFGTAELFPRMKHQSAMDAGELKLRINGTVYEDLHFFQDGGVNSINIHKDKSLSHKADIAFMVDATGSMGDELEYLKVELIDVIGRVKAAKPDVTINLGAVFYRDTDDEFLTRLSAFSTDIDKTIGFIKEQSANGGGDFPEAVHTALNRAVNELQWSADADERILFLVLDAPPHYDPDIISTIHQLVAQAAASGIKLIPVVASGIDVETEFLMRYMAIATNGTYVFITNDSGIGNEHLQPTVGEYQVELLNALMERLIIKYIE
jgi:hypothetical protein